MALPGPAPKPNKIGRTPTAEWTDVPDVPNLAARSRELPARVLTIRDDEGCLKTLELPWQAQTLTWWEVVRELPHTALWTEADWLFATDTAYLKDVFYAGSAKAGEMTEMRRREDLMGVSLEARRKLRIRYVPVIEAAPEAGAPTVLDERRARRSLRRRLLDDEDE